MKKFTLVVAILLMLFLAEGLYAQTDSTSYLFEADFFELAATGTPASVQAAIEKGADIEARAGKYGPTPLMLAARENPNPEVITVLLQAGADVNEKCRGRGSVIKFAALNPNPEVITMLLQAGADVNDDIGLGDTPLMRAARWNQNPEVITVLLKAGARVDVVREYDDRTPLIYAVMSGHEDVVRILLDAGADINARDWDGNTAINHARENGHTEIVELLIEAGAK